MYGIFPLLIAFATLKQEASLDLGHLARFPSAAQGFVLRWDRSSSDVLEGPSPGELAEESGEESFQDLHQHIASERQLN